VLGPELGADAAHVDIDRARAAVVVIAPDAAQQRLAREHALGMRHEELQQLVLHVREVHGPLVDRDLVGREVHLQAADADDVVVVDAVDRAPGAGDPRLQLVGAERLDDQLVALGDPDPLRQLAAVDRDEDRHLAELVVGGQARAQLRARRLLGPAGEDERQRGGAAVAVGWAQRPVGGDAVGAEAELGEQARRALAITLAVDPRVAQSSLR
jgi:hypothetical protein